MNKRIVLVLNVLFAPPAVSTWQAAPGQAAPGTRHRTYTHDEEASCSSSPQLISRRQWTDTILTSLAVPSLVGGGNAMTPFPATAAESTTSTTTRTTKPHLAPEYFQSDAVATAPQAGRFFFPTLTPPFRSRATYRYTLGRQAWALEQLLTFFNVTATIRCNVVQLKGGGLWVHSPQWPTGEFCQLLDDLTLAGPVEHVVLPCNALEHKAPMKSFVQRYPHAQVWIAPGQYGPFGECTQEMMRTTTKDGTATSTTKMGYRVDGILGDPTSPPPPWVDEFDMATLYVDLPQNAGPVSEVAFCHRPTKTLIATDAVVFIPGETARVPDIFGTYFDRDILQDPTFWPRTALQAVFLPLRTSDDDKTGNYPGFEALKNRLVRAPILRAFADGRAPEAVRDWVQQIAQWDFDRILTSHFASPVIAGPRDFAEAYGYLMTMNHGDGAYSLSSLPPIACRDWELLENLNQIIADYKLGAPKVFRYEVGCQ